MTYQANIIADSVSVQGKRIVSFELEYPRWIHGELMTHRVFSRNAMSSRAIPVAKMIARVIEDPATPIIWGSNKPGMQAGEALPISEQEIVENVWKEAAKSAAGFAEKLMEAGLHKQWTNRLLEPFQYMKTIVTATEWDNFFELRTHEDAQPEFRHLAVMMRDAMYNSKPVVRASSGLLDDSSQWHMPYITEEERSNCDLTQLRKMCTARCARVSYLTHGGNSPKIEEDLALYEKLVGSKPWHASPTEHAAMVTGSWLYAPSNFVGWTQFRTLLEYNFA